MRGYRLKPLPAGRAGRGVREPAGARRPTPTATAPPRPRSRPSSTPDAAPEWRRISDGPSAVWHDRRARSTAPDPPAVTDDRDGHARGRAQLAGPAAPGRHADMVVRGDITSVPGPSPWPWVLVAVALFAAALAAAGGYRRPRVLRVVGWWPWPPTWSTPPGRCSPPPPRWRRSSTGPSPRPAAGWWPGGRLPAAPRAHRRQPDLPAPRRGVPDPGRSPARPAGPGPLPARLRLRPGRHPGGHHRHPRPRCGHGGRGPGRAPGARRPEPAVS